MGVPQTSGGGTTANPGFPGLHIGALMLRIAPYKNNLLSEAEAKINLAMQIEENGKMMNKFYNLDLEITKINSLALSWTIVHPIDDKSPLYNFNYTDSRNAHYYQLII